MKYTNEKILYLASRRWGLNVSLTEHPGTDLSQKVGQLLSRGHIQEVARDDSDRYYRTTKSGHIALLRLQISWRKAHGKDTENHEAELKSLLNGDK